MSTEVSLIDRIKDNVPIMQHYSVDKIIAKSNDWRKGEKPVFEILKWGFIVGLVYGVYFFVTTILPQLLMGIGLALAVVAGVAVLAFAFMAVPLYLKVVRGTIRKLHERWITHDPFLEFSLQEQSFIEKREIVKQGRIANKKMCNQMEEDGRRSEEEAKEFEQQIKDLKDKIDKAGDVIATNLMKKGEAYKTEDEYIQKTIARNKMIQESSRVSKLYTQSINFTSMYNSKYAVLKKFSIKLDIIDSDLENKLLDFRTSVQILRKEYDFVKQMKNTTQSIKSILGITDDWELNFAFNVVRNTIDTDLATISTDMEDINKISTYNIDSEELYNDLDRLTKQIDIGEIYIPNSKDYKNPEYKFTSQDKSNLKGLDSLLD